MSMGAGLSRNEIRTDLAGRDAECRLNGVYLGRRDQRLDHLTRVDHRAAGGTTRETYKGVLDDTARGAFQGKIRVCPGAVNSDARQSNHNLLLSDGAEAAAKPELEILADDVKCSHGATVGELDRDALYYLRARGIARAAAEQLLVEAFVGALIEESMAKETAPYFQAAFATWLESAGR